MEKSIVITITEVVGKSVSYSGSPFSRCSISNFPHTPKVGEKFVLFYDTKNPAKIIKIVSQ